MKYSRNLIFAKIYCFTVYTNGVKNALFFPLAVPEEGDIMLEGGDGDHEGRVCYYDPDDGWGTVCSWQFGWNDAHVICRQLGYE